MKVTYPISAPRAVRALIVVLAALAFLPAAPLRADTIVLKTATGTTQVDGTIESINAKEMVYTSGASEQPSQAPIDSVMRIIAPKEPELTAAEQAYADGKWADAVTGYQSALSASTADWAKYRAIIRLIDAAARDKQLGPQVAAFIELAKRDPANAQAHRPQFAGLAAGQIGAAIAAVGPALKSPGLKKESADVLREFLANLYLARGARSGGATLVPATAPAAATGGAIGPVGPDFAPPSRRIIFVCDGSASMDKKSATLKDELHKAIDGLKPAYSFNIIFFQPDGCAALDKAQLVAADRDGKRNAMKFLDDVTFAGSTDPIPGLTLAFQQHPQLIYLLTNGNFRDNKAVGDKIAALNKDHQVKVNTIAFLGKDDTDTDFLLTLQEIAQHSGGTFKHVTEEELKE